MVAPNSDELLHWPRLLREFKAFVPEAADRHTSAEGFVQALIQPVPKFVEVLLAVKMAEGCQRPQAVKALYFFLLEKRYQVRLNLLYFAFDVFDENDLLPEAVVNATPFPHEDGYPPYRQRLNPTFQIVAEPDNF
jgi:hypothetical protein